MMKNLLLAGLALTLFSAAGERPAPQEFPVLSGPYLGQRPPGNVPEKFLPDIIKDPHGPVVFSPDGKQAYWREMNRKSLLFTEEIDGVWMTPRPVPFKSALYRMDAPFFSQDGKRLYFLSNRPLWGHERIWFVEKRGNRWSSWRSAGPAINDFNLHWLFSVAADGTIYFAGRRGGSGDLWHIYRSPLRGDCYDKAEKLDSTVNAVETVPAGVGYAQTSPFIAPDQSYLIFASRRPDDAVGRGLNLYIAYRRGDGTWSPPVNLSRRWGLPGNELCPILSPDGKYLFFLRWGVYWVSADFIEELRPKASFSSR